MLQGEFDLGIGSTPGPRRPERCERLFFCMLLDPDAAFRVDRLRWHFCAENHIAGTLRGRKRLHISLHHLGDYTRLPSRIIYAARQAGYAVSMTSFDVVLHSIGSFRNAVSDRHPLVLHAEGSRLVELHRMLGATMREIGLKAKEHFRPHVTVLYGPDIVPKQAIEPIRFTVKEFVLIHSELGLSRYNVLGRWPLNIIQ
jgi:RNA 2',3'-cyclic 3'-phosphodiesterase